MIRLEGDQVLRAQELLRHIPGGAARAIVNAINRAAESARTEIARQVSSAYIIKEGAILETITIKKATVKGPDTQERLWATVRARDTRRPLIQFQVSPKQPNPKRPPKVLRVAVKRGEGLKPYPGAFVNVGRGAGRLHVLRRTGPDRYPIHIKYGPSIPEMIGAPSVRGQVEQKAQQVLVTRLNHEIMRMLKEANK